MIDPRVKEAWKTLKFEHWKMEPYEAMITVGRLMDSYLDEKAGRRMAEFKLEHDLNDSPMGCADPRHTWTLAQWRAELEREMNT